MDWRDELVAIIGRASAAARAIRMSDRTPAWSHRWRGLKFVRATACASHTSGTAASSHNAAGAVHVSTSRTPRQNVSYRDPALPCPPFRQRKAECRGRTVEPPWPAREAGADRARLVAFAQCRARKVRHLGIPGIDRKRALR